MFTDMVGSTASAQANEAEALRLRDEQAALVRPLFTAHQGREIKSMGDGFLAEFDSALRAVQCAIDIQQHLHERNSQPGVPPIQLRIGVHLGDVEQRESDIFGDAVNIASRIQPLAAPGGVCISGEVFSQIRNKIPNKLEKLPPAALKGVQTSMDIYRVALPWAVRDVPLTKAGPRRLAVLPFTNISPDPKDEYFADGLTEELITGLSQLRELRVIARTSVSQYKATAKPVSQIGPELGVDAVLEGSVRKAGDDLRITVQLIDVETQEHTWAKTYDRKLDNVFAVQGEIAKRVAEALRIGLREAEEARLESRPRVKPESYLAYLKGRALMHVTSKDRLAGAREQFELALSLDPSNAAAYSGLADAMRMVGWWHSDIPRAEWEANCNRLVTRAIELDPNLAEAHASLALGLWDEYNYQAAEQEFKRALSLNPSYAAAHWGYGMILEDEGRADEALIELRLAEEADPLSALVLFLITEALIWARRLDEARVRIQRARELEPTGRMYHQLLASYHLAKGEVEASVEELRQAHEVNPDEVAEPIRNLQGSHLLALGGEKEKARTLLKTIEDARPSPSLAHHIAWVYAELGDLDGCFRWLEKAVEDHSIALQRWRLDPRREHVRSDPRFHAMMKRMNLA